MKKSKISSFTLTLLSVWILSFDASRAMAAKDFPKVVSVLGKVELVSMDAAKVPLKVKTVLRGKTLIETGASSQAVIAWDEARTLTVLPNSVVLIPSIGWDSGEASSVLLKSGSMHWQAGEEKAYPVVLSSDLFQFIAPPGDFTLTFSPEKAWSEISVVKGRLDYTYLNGEEMVLLQKGQKVGFQGVIEDGKISYDVLLQGRKVPKGKLTAVTTVDTSEMDRYNEQLKKKQAELERKRALLARQKKPGQICDKPAAKLNECAWVCDGNPKKEKKICHLERPEVKCVRTRCNANGDWAERQVVDAEKAQSLCKAEPRVAACDY